MAQSVTNFVDFDRFDTKQPVTWLVVFISWVTGGLAALLGPYSQPSYQQVMRPQSFSFGMMFNELELTFLLY